MKGCAVSALIGRFCSSVSVLGLAVAFQPLLATSAAAQEAAGEASASSGEQSGDIVVTASRISRAGFKAPTPLTVVGQEDLRQSGVTNIGAALNDFPSFRASSSPTTTTQSTGAGVTSADLRGLGEARTLVLIDGHRIVPTTRDGFNLNMVPFPLVERVEVVTGGASAAWGSGAVAGVVNVILDKDFDGLEAEAQYGVSSRGDGDEYKFGLAYGTPFADGRGHISIAGEYVDSKGIRPATSRRKVGNWQLIPNPDFEPGNGQSEYVIAPDVHFAFASEGGLIVSGPLAGTQFGSGGVPRPFNYGSYRGFYMSGGDGVNFNDYAALQAPVERKNLFARASYDLTENVKVFGEGLYSDSSSRGGIWPEYNFGNLVISADNPFIPAETRAQMAALGLSSLALGRINADFGSIYNRVEFQTMQGTAGLEGDLGSGWSWSAYYAYGHTDHDNDLSRLRITSRFRQSLDAVTDPANGQPVCRSTLTDPSNGCVPVNIFGPGSASPAALAYFQGTASVASDLTQQVAAASLQGQPFSTWAGPVSIAAGGEWRRETIENTPDPLSASKSFSLINFAPLKGDVEVKEVFGEAVVPLLADLPFVKSLELNGAIRASDYSTSGTITSWKVGLSYQITDDLRLRGTRSRDIRAPSLAELFLQMQLNTTSVVDPTTSKQTAINQFTRGNTDLDPEKADTTTVGVVYQPSWLNGLRLSVDYYTIKIKGAITTISAQDTVDRCFSGNTALCGLIGRDASGAIESVDTPFLNLARAETSGVDIEAAYSTSLAGLSSRLPGTLNLRFIGTYVDDLIRDDLITRTNLIGDLGPDTGGVPHWRWTTSASYNVGGLTIDARARYVGGGAFDHSLDIDDNSVSGQTYFDLGAEYAFDLGEDQAFTLFAHVRNLTDNDPPKLPNPTHFDVVGRYFTVGARIKY